MLFWMTYLRRRHHQRQASLGRLLIRRMCILLALIMAHVASMMLFEGMELRDAIWLTFTTISTTGYGDLSAKTDLGRTATILLMYVGGVTTFAAAFADYANYQSNRKALMRHGKWNFKMRNHILVIGLTKLGRERYLRNFATELRAHAEFTGTEVLFLAPDLTEACLPEDLKDNSFRYNIGCGSRREDLRLANADSARTILVLCPDPHIPEADDITASVVHRLRDQLGYTGRIVAEVALDENRSLVSRNGANSLVRATNDYPGIAIKALAVPGSEVILEDFFQKDGADITRLPHTGPDGESWTDCAMHLLRQGYTLVGYVDTAGTTHRFGTSRVRGASHLIVLKPALAA